MGQGEEETKQKGHFTFCQEPGGKEKKRKKGKLKKKKTPFVYLTWQAGCLGTRVLHGEGLGCGFALPGLPELPQMSSEPGTPREEPSRPPP